MASRRLLEHKAFAAEAHCRLTEWEIEDWLRLRDRQRERAASPAPRYTAPTGPVLYRNFGGRIDYVR